MSIALKKPEPKGGSSIRKEEDLCAWVDEQVGHLLAGRVESLDLEGIAEELGDVGKTEYRDLRSVLAVIIQHLLKWDFQPERRSRSWVLSIAEHRARLAETLAESPSLRRRIPEASSAAWRTARGRALDETGLPDDGLPADCPYTFEDIEARPVVYDPAVHRLRD
jgi:hypothetical protein